MNDTAVIPKKSHDCQFAVVHLVLSQANMILQYDSPYMTATDKLELIYTFRKVLDQNEKEIMQHECVFHYPGLR